MAGLGFTANEYNPAQGFEPLPNGEYIAMISEAELKNTKAGTGQYIKFVWTVMDGEYSGRKVWSNHNIVNPNQTAQKIGREEISAIAHAIGRPDVNDTDHMINIPCKVSVVIKQETGRDPSNVIKKWEAISGAGFPGQQSAAPQPVPQPGTAPAGAPQPMATATAAPQPATQAPPQPVAPQQAPAQALQAAAPAGAPPWGQRQ
ncbi:DUF669 domain-containing protein [Endozoicomonas euniceicola]|uniref:DUF669 domain-containing protein n=1 Tax=Endozoicomonas euniceicola TaxID=1234143 RepID=A0ABY6GQE1_9GAMM|nr:DUF669 domain-containing protein [Endozoicomonas euniceicola]UYM14281.1 DUF669 domain-containing protein [Endozoicomonas euniceicola]